MESKGIKYVLDLFIKTVSGVVGKVIMPIIGSGLLLGFQVLLK